jgi:hypothetical protein
MNRKNIFYLLTIVVLFISIVLIIYKYVQIKETVKIQQGMIEKKISISKKFYQHIYQNFPIFEDWLNQEKKQNLRKYLYPFHIEIAKKLGLSIIKSTEEINPNFYTSIDNPEIRTYYFFYNVPDKHRYFYKDFLPILIEISKRFNEKIRFNEYPIVVKLAISSLLRPENYQEELKSKNRNAIDNSTHSYGISLDIFMDEFFVDLKSLCDNPKNDTKKQCESDLNHHGYILGGSLRRQLQSILAEVLLELQEEKKLYVIWEANQRVFHITPLPL